MASDDTVFNHTKYARDFDKANSRAHNHYEAASGAHYGRTQLLQGELQDLVAAKNAYERDYKRTGDLDSKHRANDKDAEIEEKKKEIEEHRADKPKNNAAYTLEERRKFARKNARVKFQSCPRKIEIPKGSSAFAVYAEQKANTDIERRKLHRIEGASLPVAEALKNAQSEIKRLASQGAPDVSRVSRLSLSPDGRMRPGKVEWPQAYSSDGRWYKDSFSLMFWLLEDTLVEKLTAAIEATASSNALTSAEREVAAKDSKARLLELERLEEAAFLLAVAENPSLERRRVDMQALLQIEPIPADEKEFG